MTYSNPWLVLGGALGGFWTVLLAVELVVALVKQAVTADVPGGDL